MKKHKYLLIDCETAGSLAKPIIYDLGGAIIDRDGNIDCTFSFVIKEVWNNIDLLRSAYYRKKLPQYVNELLDYKKELASFIDVINYIDKLCKAYEVKAIIAHHIEFDYRAINYTNRYLKTKKTKCFINSYPLWCTLKMSRQVVVIKKDYQAFCKKYNFLTEHDNPQATAETLYRYISKNITFQEKHTSLADVLIEIEIFQYCNKQKKKMNRIYKSL